MCFKLPILASQGHIKELLFLPQILEGHTKVAFIFVPTQAELFRSHLTKLRTLSLNLASEKICTLSQVKRCCQLRCSLSRCRTLTATLPSMNLNHSQAFPPHPNPIRYVGQEAILALLLDYDGTLSPIAPHPDLATIPSETKKVLEPWKSMMMVIL